MSRVRFGLLLVVGLSLAVAGARSAANSEATSGVTPEFQHIGKLAFGPDGVIFAADVQEVSITALHLGGQMAGGVPGTQDVAAIDSKVAGLLGIDAGNLLITDMVVDPRTRNTWLSVMRGLGAGAVPVLLRVDGAGEIEVISFDEVRYTRIGVPNPPPAETPLVLADGRAIPVSNYPDDVDPAGLIGVQTITHMAYIDGNLYVSGLSNEEFASKMRVIPYPFRVADAGTSVEIYHGSHGQLETFSPVFTFVPYEIDGEPSIVASYLCTPLVKFPVSALAGGKVQGTTIAEFGNRNRPIDMIVYEKDGQDYILLSNNQRGVMKVPTAPFGAAGAITEPIPDTAGVPFETIASLQGVRQLDQLDASRAMLLVDAAGGGLNLEAAALP